eukprot:TRINITY_DN6598_c0_g1_i3.p1 TRINITY_DN6598_c0_g1~~TRINITY_DN6598_c0_g1_i3.p1  ORF type:complete len:147 (-),score=5.23 TRINITY_DN6598_c0_g1_i3:227-667(-)
MIRQIGVDTKLEWSSSYDRVIAMRQLRRPLDTASMSFSTNGVGEIEGAPNECKRLYKGQLYYEVKVLAFKNTPAITATYSQEPVDVFLRFSTSHIPGADFDEFKPVYTGVALSIICVFCLLPVLITKIPVLREIVRIESNTDKRKQ